MLSYIKREESGHGKNLMRVKPNSSSANPDPAAHVQYLELTQGVLASKVQAVSLPPLCHPQHTQLVAGLDFLHSTLAIILGGLLWILEFYNILGSPLQMRLHLHQWTL